MATFVAKNSGGVKNKPMIILKVNFFLFLFLQAVPATGRCARIHTEIRVICQFTSLLTEHFDHFWYSTESQFSRRSKI